MRYPVNGYVTKCVPDAYSEGVVAALIILGRDLRSGDKTEARRKYTETVERLRREHGVSEGT